MMHIQEKYYLYLLFLVPLFFVIFLWLLWWKKQTQKKFATQRALQKLVPQRSVFKNWVKFFSFVWIFIALVVALANPKVGMKSELVKRQGVDIVFAIDVSKSMLAEDIKPSRISKAKHIVTNIISQLKTDRVGMVIYAGQAYPLLPLTTDYSVAKLFLQGINTDMISSQGTDIAQAVRIATDYFDSEFHNSRLMFILSDGEDHEQSISEFIENAKEKGIRIFTIGIGTEKGGTIPIKDEDGNIELKKDFNDQVVITKLNQPLLEKIAREAGGVYLHVNETQKIVDSVAQILKNIEKNEYETQVFSDYQDQFQWFLAFALLLLLLDTFIFNKKTAWVQALDLFNEKK